MYFIHVIIIFSNLVWVVMIKEGLVQHCDADSDKACFHYFCLQFVSSNWKHVSWSQLASACWYAGEVIKCFCWAHSIQLHSIEA